MSERIKEMFDSDDSEMVRLAMITVVNMGCRDARDMLIASDFTISGDMLYRLYSFVLFTTHHFLLPLRGDLYINPITNMCIYTEGSFIFYHPLANIQHMLSSSYYNKIYV